MKLFNKNYDCLNEFVEVAKKGTKYNINSVKVDLGSILLHDSDGNVSGEQTDIDALFVMSQKAEFQFIRNKGKNFQFYELTMKDKEYEKDDFGTIYLLRFLDKNNDEWILKVGSDIIPVSEGEIIDCRGNFQEVLDYVESVKQAQRI